MVWYGVAWRGVAGHGAAEGHAGRGRARGARGAARSARGGAGRAGRGGAGVGMSATFKRQAGDQRGGCRYWDEQGERDCPSDARPLSARTS